jgi:hypothetical protein
MYERARKEGWPEPEGLEANYISRWERGTQQPSPLNALLLCLVFELPAARLGLPGDPMSVDGTIQPVDRREFGKGLVGAWAVGIPQSVLIDPLAVLRYGTLNAVEPAAIMPDLNALRNRVAQARENYQACRYAVLAQELPPLLADLNVAVEVLEGDAKPVVNGLIAESHHVMAGMLLKHDDHGLAWIAADRSMSAAERTGDPLMIASSARIVTHVFMSTTHHAAAAQFASQMAQRFASTWKRPSQVDLSIYGSLLLRGAIAAARAGNRNSAHELLNESAEAATRVGKDGNLGGAAFGPTNVQVHRVHAAVRLGDAGQALELARTIDHGLLPVVERRASLHVDMAVAWWMCGRIDEAYQSLRVAELLAPEELAARPSVRELVGDLLARAPNHVMPDLRAFARRIGVTGVPE